MRGLILAAALAFTCCSTARAELKVLLLGDGGHHQPHARFEQIEPVFAGRGIAVEYTENLQDLNPKNLANYDAVLLYANIEKIEPREEQALLDYVAAGGGYVPVHCASYCFHNSPKLIALLGAQFQKHGTGEFDTTTIDEDHPITRDLEPFRTWDETYVHHKHNEQDRHVLQTRAEGDSAEPWTWVRKSGKGRIFYTAYGHDHRTWSKPGFQALLERGIRWAANQGEVFDSNPEKQQGLKPFEYVDVGGKIPDYRADNGATLNLMQQPLSPAESQKHLVLPRGFKAKLFASEPDIKKPICMAWDHRGRLWVAETFDYPNQLQPEGEGRDRITICEDTTGDGRADKFTVFADKLSIPTSLCFARGGVIVAQAPHTLYLKDTDGDDRADVREVLFSGWATNDTHAGSSNLTYGHDNWIYGMVGYAGFNGVVGDESHRFGAGFYRFRPDGSKLEFLRSTNNNSWGVGFSEDGILFGSTANGNPSEYMPIPNRYYEQVRGWTSSRLEGIAASAEFRPITDKVRQVDWHGKYTAAAGHAIYTARAYPKQYWNCTAFVNGPTGHLTGVFRLKPRGSDFVASNDWNLLASDDEWTAPIAAEVGPDGNVWVIDWYNYIVQHNPTPQGFKTGKGNAYETDLRDKRHGRIYRIVYEGEPQAEQAIRSLDPNDAPQLIAALSSDNLFWRRHAQRLLVERGKSDVAPQLAKLAADKSVDEIGLNVAAIHALWTLHGLGLLDGSHADAHGAVAAALIHPSPGVRRNALLVAPRTEAFASKIAERGLLQDEDAQVRLAAFLTLAEMPDSREVAEAIAEALTVEANHADRWIPDAATSAAAQHDIAFLQAIAPLQLPSERVHEIVVRIAEHYARGKTHPQFDQLLSAMAAAEPTCAGAIILGLSEGWHDGAPIQIDDSAKADLKDILANAPKESRGRLVALASKWGSRELDQIAAQLAKELLATIKSDKAESPSRAAAAEQLIALRPSDPAVAESLLEAISPRESAELNAALLDAASNSQADETGEAIANVMPGMTPSIRAQAIVALLRKAEWTGALLGAIESGSIQLAELSLDQQQNLAAHPDKQLARRAKQMIEQGGGLPDADRQKVIEELSKVVLAGGDAERGALVYKQQCAKCHKHNGEGGEVGPDLTGMAAHSKTELLIHMLDPSRSVEGNFRQYTVITDEGRVISGLLGSETKNAVEVIDAEGKRHRILREEIDELIVSSKSLMPEGFEKTVGAEGIADVLEFLTQRGKFVPLDLSKAATIASTRGMFHDADAAAERLILSDWSPKTLAGVPFHLVDPRGGSQPNVILLHGPQGKFPPQMPKSVELSVNSPAKAIHLLSGVSGWGHPLGEQGSISMIVRLHYADGQKEDHELKNGVHFADYIRRVDVPESQFAFALRSQQIRYLAIQPQRHETIQQLELVKGPDATAPIVMAITVETDAEH